MLHTAKVGVGQSVAVFGVGGVGLSAIGAAAIAGADPIIAVDLVDRKLQFAREFGATHGIIASGPQSRIPIFRFSWNGRVRISSR